MHALVFYIACTNFIVFFSSLFRVSSVFFSHHTLSPFSIKAGLLARVHTCHFHSHVAGWVGSLPHPPGWGMHLNHWLIRYLAGCVAATLISLGSFSKPRGRRRRECHQTKGLMSRTMTMYVRFESLYISLPSSAKQQREMTKFCVFRRTRTAMANLCYLLQELNAVGAFLAWANF